PWRGGRPLSALAAAPTLINAPAPRGGFINLNDEKARENARISQSPRRHSISIIEITSREKPMSQRVLIPPKPAPASTSMHSGAADLRMLAQVEKWMAAIREISREQQGQ